MAKRQLAFRDNFPRRDDSLRADLSKVENL